jgi:hypothetical protein
MKNFITALGFLFLSTPAFACLNKVPKSEAVRYIDAANIGQSVPGGASCEEKPDEPCLCFDEIDGWDVARVSADESGADVLVNDPAKVAAKAARVKAEKDAQDVTVKSYRDAIERLKDGCPAIDAATTNASLKTAVKACILDLIRSVRGGQ